jgi:hypothetical protein
VDPASRRVFSCLPWQGLIGHQRAPGSASPAIHTQFLADARWQGGLHHPATRPIAMGQAEFVIQPAHGQFRLM